jgi:hypothetical protein
MIRVEEEIAVTLQESLTNFAAVASLPLTYVAKNYEMISVSSYNSLMFVTVVVMTIIGWRTFHHVQK